MRITRISVTCTTPSVTCRRTGFSLIELLAVIGIIGVLASLLLAGIGPVRSMVDESRCATNLRSLAQMAQLQAADNGGYVPQGMWYMENNSAARPNLLDYGLTSELVRCPLGETDISYGINIKLITSTVAGSQWGSGHELFWKHGFYKYDQLDGSKAMLFAEATRYYSGDNLAELQFRHNGHVQASFVDGHVDKFSLDDLISRVENDEKGKWFWTRGITTN